MVFIILSLISKYWFFFNKTQSTLDYDASTFDYDSSRKLASPGGWYSVYTTCLIVYLKIFLFFTIMYFQFIRVLTLFSRNYLMSNEKIHVGCKNNLHTYGHNIKMNK